MKRASAYAVPATELEHSAGCHGSRARRRPFKRGSFAESQFVGASKSNKVMLDVFRAALGTIHLP